jgi:hypothetical protein
LGDRRKETNLKQNDPNQESSRRTSWGTCAHKRRVTALCQRPPPRSAQPRYVTPTHHRHTSQTYSIVTPWGWLCVLVYRYRVILDHLYFLAPVCVMCAQRCFFFCSVCKSSQYSLWTEIVSIVYSNPVWLFAHVLLGTLLSASCVLFLCRILYTVTVLCSVLSIVALTLSSSLSQHHLSQHHDFVCVCVCVCPLCTL